MDDFGDIALVTRVNASEMKLPTVGANMWLGDSAATVGNVVQD